MSKQRLNIEYELKSNSQGIIWNFISTASGLSRWLADDVQENGDELTFTWGDTSRHHEIRKAKILSIVRYSLIRFHWEDDSKDYFVEMRMEKSDLTGSYVLAVTDFADQEDIDDLHYIWDQNIENLHMTSGM